MRFNSVVSHINRQVFSIYRSSLQFTISIQTNNEQCKPSSKMLNVLTTQVGHCTLHFSVPNIHLHGHPPCILNYKRVDVGNCPHQKVQQTLRIAPSPLSHKQTLEVFITNAQSSDNLPIHDPAMHNQHLILHKFWKS